VQAVYAGFAVRTALAKFAGGDSAALHLLVESLDYGVRWCHHERSAAVVAGVPPAVNDVSFHANPAVAVETAVVVVEGDDDGVASSNLQAGVAFPASQKRWTWSSSMLPNVSTRWANLPPPADGGEVPRVADGARSASRRCLFETATGRSTEAPGLHHHRGDCESGRVVSIRT
jgi:hypothetical protein